MHSPSASRQILRELRNGADPAMLIPKAMKIPDPDHAARTLFYVSSDRRLPWDEARRAIRKVELLLPQVEKPSRAAELAVEVYKKTPEWRENARNPEAAPRREALREACVDVLTELPPGPWNEHLGLVATERSAFERAVELGLHDVVRKGIAWHPRWLDDVKDPKLRALAGDVAAVWTTDAETVRIVAWHPDTDPLRFAQSVPDDPAKQVHAWTLAGARLDKEGKDGATWLRKAASVLADVPEPERKKLARKLHTAMEKAGLADTQDAADDPPAPTADPQAGASLDAPREPAAAPTPEPSAKQAPATPDTGSTGRSVLGLVDGYQGAVKAVHLRALARAAPLCVAFDLDLGVYGFPTDDLAGLVAAAGAETNVGEGKDYLQQLLDAGRIHHESRPFPLVASTPHPDAAKRGVLPQKCVLLMGLGRQGLPKRFLEEAEVHYEITGQDVSLETATAMGILAERLRATGAPQRL